MTKKEKITQKMFIGIFISLIFIIPTFTAIDKDRDKSVLENRKLAQSPKIDRLTLFNGKFFNSFEEYFADQLYGRDNIMNAYSSIQLRLLEKKKIENVVIGKDGFLLPYKDYISENDNIKSSGDGVLKALQIINETIKTYNGDLYYLYIPHKGNMYDDKYPSFYEDGHDSYIEKNEIKLNKIKRAGINTVDATSVLEEAKRNGEYIYFKTDHHYNFKGAYYSYQELLKAINNNHPEYNLTYPQWDSMSIKRLDKKFIGSYLKQTGNIEDNHGDYYEYALPNDFPKYDRFESGKKFDNFIFRKNDYKGTTVDHEYALGNRPNTVIKTYRDWLPNILYIGYSYTNSLEAMSVYNFNEMHSIDPRYWKGNISEYIKENKPDIVVIVRDDLYDGNKENISKIK